MFAMTIIILGILTGYCIYNAAYFAKVNTPGDYAAGFGFLSVVGFLVMMVVFMFSMVNH